MNSFLPNAARLSAKCDLVRSDIRGLPLPLDLIHLRAVSLVAIAGKMGAADEGASALKGFALEWMSNVFGSQIRKAVLRTHATSWNKQPWALGAFSSAPPGAQEARRALSEPLNDIVWFAGEAVNQTLWGTVGGAWQDGERAADAVLARLGKR